MPGPGEAQPDPRAVLVVTGTHREGAVAAAPGVVVIAGGGDSAGLARRLAQAAPGAAGIISFGMGGALAPGLALGDWVIGAAVRGGATAVADPRWVLALSKALPGALVGPVHADGALVATVAEKTRLAEGGALAVDMESHIAAEAALQAGVPFVALRCVSDAAADSLPPAIAVAMKPGGGLALGAVLASLARQPGQIPALVGSTRGFARAFRLMGQGAKGVGGRLGFDLR